MSDALVRGVEIVELLARLGQARVVDLTSTLDMSRATVFRILGTLESRGWVEHITAEHSWRVGPALAALGDAAATASLTRLAAPALDELHELTHETINLAVLQGSRVTWAATVDGDYAVRMTTTLGADVPLYCTAVGKALLSTLPEAEWDRLLPPEPYPSLTARTLSTRAALRSEVDLARSRGWALDDEEAELSGVCIAAAVLGRTGLPIAAISVSAVASRLDPTEFERVGESVTRLCRELSEHISS